MKSDNRKTRILIAHGYAAVRRSLRSLLERQPFIDVVGEAGNASEAVAHIRVLSPDVTLLDITMGRNGTGPRLRDRIARAFPKTTVVPIPNASNGADGTSILTGTTRDMRETAAGRALLETLREIDSAQGYPDCRVAHSSENNTHRVRELSRREEEALLLFAHGHSYKEMAERMGVSSKTVETYRTRIMKKLQLTSRAELVRHAITSGLLGSTPSE